MSNRTGSGVNLVATGQAAVSGIRTPRIQGPPPILPSIPSPKSGRDALSDLDYLWADYQQSYKIAYLLYMPLMQSLKRFCPEVDWSKLQQWISHYKLRRRSRDFKSYLRGEDIESFIDFMLKYHPVKKLGDNAITLNEYVLEHDLKSYFSRWDVILMKERVKREAARLSEKQSSASTASMMTLAPRAAGVSTNAPPTTSGRSTTGSSRAASADLVKKKDRFELPEKRRVLIAKLVDESINRVTRAMLAIHFTVYGENWALTPGENDGSDGHEQSTLIAIAFQPAMPAMPATPANERTSIDDPTDNIENVINFSTNVESDGSIIKSASDSSVTRTPPNGGTSPRRNSATLSPQEKEAMKQYLAAQDLLEEYGQEKLSSVDGAYSFGPQAPTFQKRLADSPERPQSASCFDDIAKTDYLKTAGPDTRQLWQPKPVSPHTQAKLYSMHQYPRLGEHYTALHQVTCSHSTLSRPHTNGTPTDIMDYVLTHAVPIGPETTPHIAMFADRRRQKERVDRDTILGHYF